jgi:hypothetical protein
MRVALLESFYTGSHKRWADGLAEHSNIDIQLVTLPGAHWKWRMHGSAVTFARVLLAFPERPDALLVSDLTDVAALRGLLACEGMNLPVAVYFHENQITATSTMDGSITPLRLRLTAWCSTVHTTANRSSERCPVSSDNFPMPHHWTMCSASGKRRW